jgi:hypothetical protein
LGHACGEPIKRVAAVSGQYGACSNEHGQRLDDLIEGWIIASGKMVPGVKDNNALFACHCLNSFAEIDRSFPRAKVVTELNDGGTFESTYGPVREKESRMIGVRNVAVISGTIIYRIARGFYLDAWE